MNIQVITKFLELKINQNRSQKSIKKLQEKKLQKILRYTYNNSDFYRKTFEQAGINGTNINSTPIERFPVINKQILFDNLPEILTDKKIKSVYSEQKNNFQFATLNSQFHTVHSSGSTGTPRYFLYDNLAWQTVMAGITRGCMWNISLFKLAKALLCGVRFLYIAATDGPYAGVESIGSTCEAFGAKSLFLDINEPLETWRKKIEDFKPNFVVGYPSGLKIIAGLVQEGNLNIELKKVNQFVTCGEPLIPGLRKNLEETFGRKIINFYGASESLALGVEADSEEGMLLFDDLNFIEVLDGRMYVTCLYNYLQPLIRYEITDRLELLEKKDFSPFTRTKIVQSRQEDIMWFEKDCKKDFIHPLSVEGICIEGILDYQFIRNGNEDFTMKIQIADEEQKLEILKELEVFFKKLLEDKQLQFVKYRIEVVDEIKADAKTGKKKLIVA